MGYSRVPTRNDPIHGHIPLNHVLQTLLPLESVQQLDEKKQLGLVSKVYPAAKHTRLEHSIGTGWAALLMGGGGGLRRMNNVRLSASDRVYLQASGILHDITHYPTSHAPERALPISHEEAMVYVLRDRRDFGSIDADEIHEALAKLEIDPQRLLRILQGDQQDILSQFLTNKLFDADKADYIPRDLLAGKLGTIEIDRIIAELELRDGRLGITNGAVTNLDAFVSSRVRGFERMYSHYKVHAGETMLVYALQHDPAFDGLRSTDGEAQYEACSDLHAMIEGQLLRQLANSDNELSAKLGRKLLQTAESWYKAVAWCGHANNTETLRNLVANEQEIRAACLEEGMLCSGYQAQKSLKTIDAPLPYFPVWAKEGEWPSRKEESFLEREAAARAHYQHVPEHAFVIYAENDTSKTRKRAFALFEKYTA